MSSAVRDLRPLSIGELLDRAFTISFKNLLPFTAIVAVVIVPEAVINFFWIRGPFRAVTDQLVALPTPGGPMPDPSRMFAAYADSIPYLLTLFAFALFLVPLSNAAVVS